MRELEPEYESLPEFAEEENEPVSKEEFERDQILSDEAEVLGDMLAEEELDTVESDIVEQEETEPTEQENELE